MPRLSLFGSMMFSVCFVGGVVPVEIAFADDTAEKLITPPAPIITFLEEVPVAAEPQSVPTESSVITSGSGAQDIEFSEFIAKDDSDTVQDGYWSGVHGGTAPGSSGTSWYRVTIPPYESRAASRKFYLDSSIKEAWVSYRMQLGTNWTPTDNVKLPGFASHQNDGWTGVAGGNGGGWGGLCKSWSARSIIVRPSSGSAPGKLVHYVYHANSENYYDDSARASDHPCLRSSNNPVQKSKRQFGETFSSSGYVTDTLWHTVTHHVKLNDPGSYNGLVELYLDGELVSSGTNLNFTDNDEYHNIAFWLQVYHGGSADKSGTTHDIFFDNFRWNAGPENRTLQD